MTPFMEDLARIGGTSVDLVGHTLVFRVLLGTKANLVHDLRRISAQHNYVLAELMTVDYYTEETELVFNYISLPKLVQVSGLEAVELHSSGGKLYITVRAKWYDHFLIEAQKSVLERAFALERVAAKFHEVDRDADRQQNEFVFYLLTDNGLKW